MSLKFEDLINGKFVIAGTCVVEEDGIMDAVAETMLEIQKKLGFTYIFKASFDKANRTSLESFRGQGMSVGLEKLQRIKDKYKVPICTDVHESYQAKPAAEVADIIQIPAYLCRQTDLLLAAGETGKIINIKKAQFSSADDMKFAIKKVHSTGNNNTLLCERGTMFGYGDLVVDTRNIVRMKKYAEVVFDMTHSVQQPNSLHGATGGLTEFIPHYANVAGVLGVKGFFLETHPNPAVAKSDGANMVNLKAIEDILSNAFSAYDLSTKMKQV